MSLISTTRNRISSLPWPVFCLVLAVATPPEASVLLGSLRLSAYRIVLLVTLAPCVWRLVGGSMGRLQWSDGLIFFHGFWAMLALVKYAGMGQGIESGGIYFIEAVGAYLIGRCFIRNARQFEALTALMMTVVMVMMGFAAMESITGQHLIRDVSRSVFGGPSLVPIEPRWGLHRAYASFDHPILYGIFCASVFAPSSYVLGKHRKGFLKYVGPELVGLGTFLSLSAGAFSALGVQIALAMWDRITRGISQRWHIFAGIMVAIWTLVSLLSNRSPIKVFLTYMTFSPGTAHNRLRVWEYGSAEALRHPLFGIGLGDWERPSWMYSGSMDNFWLATTVRYGFPAFLSLAGLLLFICVKLSLLRKVNDELQRCRSAWMTMIAGLTVAGCTVHYWNALFCLFCFLLGTGVWMTTATGVCTRSASLKQIIAERSRMLRYPSQHEADS